jgi:predicted ATPase/signal transduction histidine kinase
VLHLTAYTIEAQIYHSATTTIYRARRDDGEQPVILKCLRAEAATPESVARFKQEYELAQRVAAAYSLEAYPDPVTGQKQWVMAMEDFGGEALARRLEAAGPLPPSEFLPLAIQVAEALGQIHRAHIMHKNITPANIVFNPGEGILRIIDFGLATDLSHENPAFSSPNLLEGSLLYMSPEQTGRMNRVVDYRTDFYSLGATFYELLTGQPPFPGGDALELVHSHIARRPLSPSELNPAIPPILAEIVLKLLAKNAEDRYQSAYGLKADLAECLAGSSAQKQLPLGRHDFSEQFQIPQKLYGRETEVATLLAAFERANAAGEMVLITGSAGLGKTALAQELYKPLTRQGGYFIAGHFDQFQRNVPYASLIQAFQSLMRQLLTESEAQLAAWREKLLAALGPHGQVIVEVIPEVGLVIGPQPAIALLASAEAQRRFQRVFQSFVRVFTRPEHPLVLFLDDLQWADEASLKLLRLLLTGPDSPRLFVIGTYQEHEVGPGHPLLESLAAIKAAGVAQNQIHLAPLNLEHLTALLADALHDRGERVRPLAELVLSKTGGNPFFVNEFLKSLHAEGLLRFSTPTHPQASGWQWDLAEIRARDSTDNVVELLADKVEQLGTQTQQLLKLAACIGHQFDLETLALVYGKSPAETAAELWKGMAAELILPLSRRYQPFAREHGGASGSCYKFAHDRIQQATYSLLSGAEKQAMHWRIGQLLWHYASAPEREERLFDIVNHLNEGQTLIDPTQTQPDWDELAVLNLWAGRKAKQSAAYEPAANYFEIGISLLGSEGWQRQYDLALALHVEAAEATYLAGRFQEMERLVAVALQEGQNILDKVKLYEVMMGAYIAQNKMLEAIEVARPVLKLLGINLPEKPAKWNITLSLMKTRFILFGKRLERLIEQPEMTAPARLAAMRILSSLFFAAYPAAPDLMPLVVCQLVELSVKYGNAPGSALAYAAYGLILCGMLGDIAAGYELGQMALVLAERLAAKEFKAKTILVVNAFVRHWREPAGNTLPALLVAHQCGLETGDVEDAAMALAMYTGHSFLIGKELVQLERKTAQHNEIIVKLEQKTAFHLNNLYWQATLNLLGRSKGLSRLAGEAYDEAAMLPLHLEANDTNAIYHFYLLKLILHYLADEYPQAMETALQAETYLESIPGALAAPCFYFYDSLARLAAHNDLPAEEQRRIRLRVSLNQQKLKNWAAHAPANYQHKFYLVEAEWARVLERGQEAREYYDQATLLAREHEYPHEEALGYELAARFYFGRGQQQIGQTYLREARDAYRRWGATAKVKALEAAYPQVFAPADAGVGLDLTSVLKASQALSGEIVLSRLLTTLMELVIENAGAEVGYLILKKGEAWVIEAKGEVAPEAAKVTVLQSIPIAEIAPATLINYVIHTGEHVLLDDASRDGPFTEDPYIITTRPQSVLCTPLIQQGNLVGLLYLENNLTTGAFTGERLAVLNLLASQAAISIENANLYANLERLVEERTAELRRVNASLEASNKELNAFAHTVAHDLKYPLTPIIGYATVLKESYRTIPPEELELYLERIMEGGHKMKEIIDTLLLFAGVRQMEVKAQPLDMGAIVTEARNRLIYFDDAYKKIVLPDSWPAVLGYGPWIEEVWVNYLTNALKYGGRPPQIEVGGAVLEDGMARFWVRDNGRGLTPEEQGLLFTPFTRLDQMRFKGHGLGLSIVRRIMNKLGGEVGVESEVGRGSLFYFTLPLVGGGLTPGTLPAVATGRGE